MSRLDWYRACMFRGPLEIFVGNVAIAGALCAAFAEGRDQEQLWCLYHEHGYRLHSLWRPGCEIPGIVLPRE